MNPYEHFPHGYSPFTDEFGMTVAGCGCGEQVLPGGRECADCLMARVQASPDPDVPPVAEPVVFGPVTVTIPEVTA